MILRNVSRLLLSNPQLIKRNVACSSALWQKNPLQNEESKLRGYVMTSYLKYMTVYEQKLEKRFPSAMHIYKIFSYGIKSFYRDLKAFFKIRLLVMSLNNEEGLSELTRSEIELYNKMPKDMLKIAPVLLLSLLPFANYVIFPLAYMHPQKLLTSHFWTSQQKEEFNRVSLKYRLQHSKQTFKYLAGRSKAIKDDELKEKWQEIITLLEDGRHPTPAHILECQSLFSVGPFNIRNLQFVHKNALLRLHGLSLGYSRASRLNERAFILKEMDRAISREGGVNEMSLNELKSACFIRGLHSSALTQDDLTVWLGQWVSVSKALNEDCYSLLLHCPVLLGLNHPSNMALMLEEVKK